jgi:hypothetical protein
MSTKKRISLGALARRRMEKLDLTEGDLTQARWSGTEVEGRDFLRVYSSLPDGRRVVLFCLFHAPEHVDKFYIDDGK